MLYNLSFVLNITDDSYDNVSNNKTDNEIVALIFCTIMFILCICYFRVCLRCPQQQVIPVQV